MFSDEHPSYQDLLQPHETVKHSVKEYVRAQAHTNGVESFWAKLKRGYEGVYHSMSAKHLDRYVQEFARRRNVRPLDTIVQLERLARAMAGQRMTFEALIANPA